jgi:hypothetical protein
MVAEGWRAVSAHGAGWAGLGWAGSVRWRRRPGLRATIEGGVRRGPARGGTVPGYASPRAVSARVGHHDAPAESLSAEDEVEHGPLPQQQAASLVTTVSLWQISCGDLCCGKACGANTAPPPPSPAHTHTHLMARRVDAQAAPPHAGCSARGGSGHKQQQRASALLQPRRSIAHAARRIGYKGSQRQHFQAAKPDQLVAHAGVDCRSDVVVVLLPSPCEALCRVSCLPKEPVRRLPAWPPDVRVAQGGQVRVGQLLERLAGRGGDSGHRSCCQTKNSFLFVVVNNNAAAHTSSADLFSWCAWLKLPPS